MTLTPLRFEPIFKPYVWGGRRLAGWYPEAPATGPIAEAWLISDEPANPSLVADGRYAGRTLHQLIHLAGSDLVPKRPRFDRFPLLLKFLDAKMPLSVQVHPTDSQAMVTRPEASGKTEAWVVLRAEPGACLYNGLKAGVDRAAWDEAIRAGSVVECLHRFEPAPGDCVFVPAGTVHAIGAGLTLFEIQQTSDITYRLFDWGRDRELHLESGVACIDFSRGPVGPVTPVIEASQPVRRERLIDCHYFQLWRLSSDEPFEAGAAGECRVVVGLEGQADIVHDGRRYPLAAGTAWLLPAAIGRCKIVPARPLTILECGMPE
jgi:mannose-6-phosphate isomerase